MASQEFQGEDVNYTLPKDYLKKVVEKIDWASAPYLNVQEDEFKCIVIALLVQNNLIMEKMCNLMAIASGLSPADIPTDIGDIDESVKSAVGKSFQCPKCSKVVVPNALGYCPKCKADLKMIILRNQD